MIATIGNVSSTDAIPAGSLPFPFDSLGEIAASGSVTTGVNEDDLMFGEDKGDPAWKRINQLIQNGEITVSFAAAAGNSVDVLEDASTT
jgi:hypothetical protein